MDEGDLSLEYLQGLEDGMLLSRQTILSGSRADRMNEYDLKQDTLAFDYLIQQVQKRRYGILRVYVESAD